MSKLLRKCTRYLSLSSLILVIFAIFGSVRAAPIISLDNLSSFSTYAANGTSISQTTWKAVGFTAVGPSLFFTRFDALLQDYGVVATIQVSLHDDAAGQPGAIISPLGTATVGPNQVRVASFFPSSSVLLDAGTAYWIVLKELTGNAMRWDRNSALTAPTGTYIWNGYLISGDSGANWASSTTYNAFTIYTDAPSAASGENLPAFVDGRINNYDTGNPVVVYGQEFADGRGLVIYSTGGALLLVVSPEEIAAVPECPEVNTLIASNGAGVALYRLAGSCLYQINAPTAEAGKIYTLIFAALYENTGYTSYEEYIR